MSEEMGYYAFEDIPGVARVMQVNGSPVYHTAEGGCRIYLEITQEWADKVIADLSEFRDRLPVTLLKDRPL